MIILRNSPNSGSRADLVISSDDYDSSRFLLPEKEYHDFIANTGSVYGEDLYKLKLLKKRRLIIHEKIFK